MLTVFIKIFTCQSLFFFLITYGTKANTVTIIDWSKKIVGLTTKFTFESINHLKNKLCHKDRWKERLQGSEQHLMQHYPHYLEQAGDFRVVAVVVL